MSSRQYDHAYTCPHCFETVDTEPDLGGGEQQTYVEDCPLCCRPNRLYVQYDVDLGHYIIDAASDL